MKELFIDACEELEAELGREPTDAEAWSAYQGRIEGLYDRADNDRKRAREEQ